MVSSRWESHNVQYALPVLCPTIIGLFVFLPAVGYSVSIKFGSLKWTSLWCMRTAGPKESLCQLRQNSTFNSSGKYRIACAFRPFAGSICLLERLHSKLRTNMSLLDSVRHRFSTSPDLVQLTDHVFLPANLGPWTFERGCNDTII